MLSESVRLFSGGKFTGGRPDRRTDRRTDTSPHISAVFFPHISCQRQFQLLCYCCLVMWRCFVGHFSFFNWVKDLCSYQTVRPTCSWYAQSAFTLVRFTNTAPLILPPGADQHRSEISPLATSPCPQGAKQVLPKTAIQHSNKKNTQMQLFQTPLAPFVKMALLEVGLVLNSVDKWWICSCLCCETSFQPCLSSVFDRATIQSPRLHSASGTAPSPPASLNYSSEPIPGLHTSRWSIPEFN